MNGSVAARAGCDVEADDSAFRALRHNGGEDGLTSAVAKWESNKEPESKYVARSARTAELIEQLLAVVRELENLHPGRKFPLDGHLVGSIGEAAAESLFAITLAPASTAGYDAVTADDRKVEIKATFGATSVAIRPTSGKHRESALIVLRLSKQSGADHEVVYNGPLVEALQVAGATKSNGQAVMHLAHLRALNKLVPDEGRVPLRDPH